ncbi:MAG: dihydroorotate dehydrogenase electron transfer subunit [Candidatus Nitrospinota bacterium M3_3B_026]
MNCIVRVNKTLAPDFFYLSLEPVQPMKDIRPGQFVMVRCSSSTDPFLRRPMSIADFNPDGSRFGLVIRMTGRGTHMLSTLVPWDHVDVLGPFGNGFTIPDGAKSAWIVVGGSGVAPFLGLLENAPEGEAYYTVFMGAADRERLFFGDAFEEEGARVIKATEDGSEGFRGMVTGPLLEKLEEGERPDVILSCGPAPMMRAVAEIARERGIPLFVSMENRMACGFGACLGCVAKTRDGDGYVTVCRRGPVFDAADVEI